MVLWKHCPGQLAGRKSYSALLPVYHPVYPGTINFAGALPLFIATIMSPNYLPNEARWINNTYASEPYSRFCSGPLPRRSFFAAHPLPSAGVPPPPPSLSSHRLPLRHSARPGLSRTLNRHGRKSKVSLTDLNRTPMPHSPAGCWLNCAPFSSPSPLPSQRKQSGHSSTAVKTRQPTSAFLFHQMAPWRERPHCVSS